MLSQNGMILVKSNKHFWRSWLAHHFDIVGVTGSSPVRCIHKEEYMLTNIILGCILVVMIVFVIGGVFLADEEDEHRK